MKAIYTIIDDKVYRINQSTGIPSTLKNRYSSSVSKTYDRRCQQLCVYLEINGLRECDIKANSEKYTELTSKLLLDKTTKIESLENTYKIFVDYTIYRNSVEHEHSCVIKSLTADDVILPLGINESNECCYIRAKDFNINLEFLITDILPIGIMQPSSKEYVLKINNIILFQEISPELHESIESTPYKYGSATIQTSLENSFTIYSTKAEGMDISEFACDGSVRKLIIHAHILLGNYTTVYDDSTITAILTENATKPEED